MKELSPDPLSTTAIAMPLPALKQRVTAVTHTAGAAALVKPINAHSAHHCQTSLPICDNRAVQALSEATENSAIERGPILSINNP